MKMMTRAGFETIGEKLKALHEEKKRLSRAMGVAAENGDLSENADYHAAKEGLMLNSTRCHEYEEMLSGVTIIDHTAIAGEARMGARIKVLDLTYNEEEEYHLVSSVESDPMKYLLSVDSPLGKALLGKKPGDLIEYAAPKGIQKFKVLTVA